MKNQFNLNRNLLLVLLYVLVTSFSYANNVLIKIDDPEGKFTRCNLQRLQCGTIYDAPYENEAEPLIVSHGTEIELQIDSFFVGFLMNEDKHAFFQYVFISAGDTVTLTPKKVETNGEYILYKLIAKGKNDANYNYLAEKQSNYPHQSIINDKNPYSYKDVYQNLREKRLAFLNERKKTISSDLYNYELAEIENEYAFTLYNYVNDGIRQSKSYFESVQIRANLLVPCYYFACFEKFRYEFLQTERNNDNALDFLINNYSGKILEYLITNYIAWSVKNDIQIIPRLSSVVKEYIHDTYYLSCIKFFEYIAQINNKNLPDSILNETHLIEYKTNRKITLKEFFAEQTNELCYIDFWASWCTACRWVIREAKDRNEILKNKQMQLIYFSIDADEQKWRKAVEDDEIGDYPNYLIVDGIKSPLCKYIYLKAIPHYTLVNKEGMLIQAQATRIEELH